MAQQSESCTSFVEDFCTKLWDEKNLGNLNLKIQGKDHWIEMGEAKNGLTYERLKFYKAMIEKNHLFPKDVQVALKKNQIIPELQKIVNRKERKNLNVSDLSLPEWNGMLIERLGNIYEQVSWIRADAKYPGYYKVSPTERSREVGLDTSRNLDMIKAEVSQALWGKNENWLKIENLFQVLKAEYLLWIDQNSKLSASLKADLKKNISDLKIKVPGANQYLSYTRTKCGIDEVNAYYNADEHEVTVCAGLFNTTSAMMVLAHEMGHALTYSKRLQEHWKNTAFGKNMSSLWTKSMEGQTLNCQEWESFKSQIIESVKNPQIYVSDDQNFLEGFLQKKLKPIKNNSDMDRLVSQAVKAITRSEVDSKALEAFLVPDEVLRSGKKIPSLRYLRPAASFRWARPNMAYSWVPLQYELFFAESYRCQLEKKNSIKESLSKAIEEAEELSSKTMKYLFISSGPFSFFKSMLGEGYSEDIDENLADYYASSVTASLLNKIENQEDRKNTFLYAMAFYCSEPSFREFYPVHAAILKSFSNRPHSISQQRRQKIMTPELRQALKCE